MKPKAITLDFFNHDFHRHLTLAVSVNFGFYIMSISAL